MNHHTRAFNAIAWISLMTSAVEWAKRVDTVSIQVTGSGLAFIDIYDNSNSILSLITNSYFQRFWDGKHMLYIHVYPTCLYHLTLTFIIVIIFVYSSTTFLTLLPSQLLTQLNRC